MRSNNSIELESKTIAAPGTLSNDEFALLQETAFSSPHLLEKMILDAEVIEKLLLKRNKQGDYLSKKLTKHPEIFSELLKKVSAPVVDQILIEQALSAEQAIAACKFTNTTTAIDKAFLEITATKRSLIANIVKSKRNCSEAEEILNKMSVSKIEELLTTIYGNEKHNLLHYLSTLGKLNSSSINTVLKKVSSACVATSINQMDKQNCSPIYFLLSTKPNVDLINAILAKAQLSDYDLSELFIKPQYDNAALLMFAVQHDTDANQTFCLSILKKLNTQQMQQLLTLRSKGADSTFMLFVNDLEMLKTIYATAGIQAFNEALCFKHNYQPIIATIFNRATNEVILYILEHIDANYLNRYLNTMMLDKILNNPKIVMLLIKKISVAEFMRQLKKASYVTKISFNVPTLITILNQASQEFYPWYKSNFARKPNLTLSIFCDATSLIDLFKQSDEFTATQYNAWLFIADLQLKNLKVEDVVEHDKLQLFKYKIYLKKGEQDQALKCIEEITNPIHIDTNTEFEIVNLYRTQLTMHASENASDKSFNAINSFDNLIIHAKRLLTLTENAKEPESQAIFKDIKNIYEELKANNKHNEDKSHSDSNISNAVSDEKFKQQLNQMLFITKTFKNTPDKFFSNKNRNIFNKLNNFYNELKFSAAEERLEILIKGIQEPTAIKEFDDLLKSMKQDLELNSKLLNVSTSLKFD